MNNGFDSYNRPWKPQMQALLTEVTGCDVIPYGYVDFGRQVQPETICVILSGAEIEHAMFPTLAPSVEKRAFKHLEELRPRLPAGFVAYIGTRRWLNPLVDQRETDYSPDPTDKDTRPAASSDDLQGLGVINKFIESGGLKKVMRKMQPRLGIELAVGPGESQLEILKLAGTAAPNYGLTSEEIIEKLNALDQRFGISILQAASDMVCFELKSKPEKPAELAEELFEFCPDLECTETIESYATKLNTENASVNLWWD